MEQKSQGKTEQSKMQRGQFEYRDWQSVNGKRWKKKANQKQPEDECKRTAAWVAATRKHCVMDYFHSFLEVEHCSSKVESPRHPHHDLSLEELAMEFERKQKNKQKNEPQKMLAICRVILRPLRLNDSMSCKYHKMGWRLSVVVVVVVVVIK